MCIREREKKRDERKLAELFGIQGSSAVDKNKGARAETEAAGSELDRKPYLLLPLPHPPRIASAVIITLAALGGRNVERCESFGRREREREKSV